MRRTLVTVLLLMISVTACGQPPPKSIDELRAADRDVSLSLVGEIQGGAGFSARIYSYNSAGLKVHALVATPDGPPPKGGYPVLVANHGHHPDPPSYGVTADGKDWRPGDYYRRIPELFAAHGFMVVMPDFRGHNNSEGLEFTEGLLESSYYTEDVLNLIAGLGSLDTANQDDFFMWGHSMGGEVTLRTLLATDRIKAASMWSSVGGDIWDQSYYYSRYEDPTFFDSSETPKPVIERLKDRLGKFGDEFDYRGSEPLLHLDYLATLSGSDDRRRLPTSPFCSWPASPWTMPATRTEAWESSAPTTTTTAGSTSTSPPTRCNTPRSTRTWETICFRT